MKNLKSDPTKTTLIISVGFLVIYLITVLDWENPKMHWAISVSLIVGLIGVFSPFLSKIIDYLWMKLTWLLSLIIPNVLLSLVFYLFLFPIATLSKLISRKDPLMLKNKTDSIFQTTNKTFDGASFENPW